MKGHRLSRLGVVFCVACAACAFLSCRPDHHSDIDGDLSVDSGRDARQDHHIPDSRPDTHYDADPVDPCGEAVCGDQELCGADGRGDGYDNDCDTMVDEDCECQPLADSMACFGGPPDRRNRGACSDGVQTCSELGTWNRCHGHVLPTEEICDGMDNDCDGDVDEQLSGCVSAIVCPGGQGASPLSSFALTGSEIYSGATTSWTWEVTCPSTVPEGSCPAPTDPSATDTDVYFVSSGTYRVTATIETTEGETFVCSFAVWVQGAGLRVELNWDTQGEGRGNTDVDLHLHRSGTQGDFFTEDDCYFSNCKGSNHSIDWGLPSTDIAGCQDAPHGHGEEWREIGSCANPRLDVDVIRCDPTVRDASADDFCAPENINVDNPIQGDVYRIMVNFYSAHGHSGETHPSINVYCAGDLRASFGAQNDVILRNGDGYGSGNDNWLVGDVRFFTDQCGQVTCEVQPLETIVRGPDFGPPWSW